MKYLQFLILSLYIHAANASITMQDRIDQIINSNLSNSMFGMVVQDAETGKQLYNYQGNKYFIPASTTKLFVTAAALYELMPTFRFVTQVKYNKDQLKGDILYGDLGIIFKGDPSFTNKDLEELIQQIKLHKISSIKGNIILDQTYFDKEYVSLEWGVHDLPWYYAAPISALILNENRIAVTIQGTSKLKQLATANITGENQQYFKLINTIKTVTEKESETLCRLKVEINPNNVINLGGCWPINKEEILQLSIPDNKKIVGSIIKETLAKTNINLQGEIIFQKAPFKDVLLQHDSEPLVALISKVLSDSNNIYAEVLGKTLGKKILKRTSFINGTLATKTILQKSTGINMNNVQLFDSSGISRYNLVTPLQLTRLLYTMFHDPKLKSPYMQALAVSGTQGTLKSRLAAVDTIGNIRAKTGTMRGISALAGYITTKSNKTLIVTMMVNNSLLKADELKKIEDELCQAVINETD